MSVIFNLTKNHPVNEDQMSGQKSGVTEIFRHVNKLTHINMNEITKAANKLKGTTNRVASEREIIEAISEFQNEIRETLNTISETISNLKRIKN